MNLFLVNFSILCTLIIFLPHCVLIILLSFQFQPLILTYMQYLNTFACIITSLFLCSRNYYTLYYDLFHIQRFCYLPWISGMWNKLQLQLQLHVAAIDKQQTPCEAWHENMHHIQAAKCKKVKCKSQSAKTSVYRHQWTFSCSDLCTITKEPLK